VATEPLDVQDDSGTMLSYVGGLEPIALTEQLGRLKFTTPDLSATIRCQLPVSVSQLRRRGYDWLSASAELYLTVIDTEDARLTVPSSVLKHGEMWLQIKGRPRSPVWGRPGDPPGAVEFSLQLVPWDDQQPLIPASDSIIEENHDPGFGKTFPDEVRGKRYPEVLGTPGAASGSFGAESGTPVYPLRRNGSGEAERLLVARGRVAAGSVVVRDAAGNTDTLTTIENTDDNGNPFMVVTPGVATSPLTLTDSQFWATWSLGAGSIGQTVDGVTTAPEAAVYLLQSSGLDVDIPAWSALAGQVPRVDVSIYVNDDSTAWQVVSTHVLPMMPVAYRYTRQGLAPVVYDPAVYQSETVAHVRTVDTPAAESSGDWTPLGGMALETEPEDVAAAVDVVMAYNPKTGRPRDVRRWAANPSARYTRRGGYPRADNESGSIYLDHAATRGAAGTIEITLGAAWDVNTADAVASWRSRLAAMPTYSMEYAAPLYWGWLQVGDALTITDPGRGLDGAIVLIDSKSLEGQGWRFTVLLDEDPVRDSRALD
jgi:hypothetical protein